MFLENLCNTDGVCGNESEIRKLIKQEVSPYASDIICDTMGNLIVYKKGKDNSKKIMITAHTDEVGFIVTGYTEKGYLEFKTVGKIDTKFIISKRVRFKNGICGVIGIKAIHLQSKEERKTVPDISSFFIDIGAKTEDEAKNAVSLGSYAAFETLYSDFGDDKFKAKAIDSRAGCYVTANALKYECPYDLYAVFTVQEKIGFRGAKIAAHRINPDVCLTADGVTCADMHATKPDEHVTSLGDGAALSFIDKNTISDKELTNALYNAANEKSVPVQFVKSVTAGNDSAAIQRNRSGIRTASLLIPCRYIDSPVSVASKADLRSAMEIIRIYCENIGGLLKWN